MKTIELTCSGHFGEKFQCMGYDVNEHFGVRPADELRDLFHGWAVIHKHSGFAAGLGYRSREVAVQCAKALTECGRDWAFIDPKTVIGWKDCSAIVKKHLAMKA